jgi:hypothetical protein
MDKEDKQGHDHILLIWGVISFCYFWNEFRAWLDRGYWNQLQRAALTTFSSETLSEISKDKVEQKI